MFQTEIHHFFQSFSNEYLNLFMQFLTALGYKEFLMALIALLMFGIHFKKGFIFVQILLWTAVITFFAKYYFALPRPFHVDSSLQLLDYYDHGHGVVPFLKQGAVSFWGLLPTEVTDYYRNSGQFSYGFPSGHTSAAVTVWGGLALLFRKKWLTYLSIALIILIPFSRVYLGVHFLADIIGGYILGGIILWALYQLILKPSKLEAFLKRNTYTMDFKMALFVFCPILLIPFLPRVAATIPAFMLGFNIVFYLVASKGLPINTLNWKPVIGGSALFLFLLGGILISSKFLASSINMEGNDVVRFFRYFVGASVGMWLTTIVAYKLKWFQKSENEIG
ncbi:MAG: phosphatase PAP2 family protein [Chitinophagales bacterium]